MSLPLMSLPIIRGSQSRRRRLGVARWLLLALSLLAFGPAARIAADSGPGAREYEIKAAFLYNFVKFVDWPAQSLPPNNTLIIGVLGKNPFGAALDTINGKSVKGRTLVVRQLRGINEAAGCQILFVSTSERERLKQVLEALRNDSVLTVGEMPDFSRAGGIINFTLDSNHIRFEINPAAAERARLTISAQLLKLAKVVRA